MSRKIFWMVVLFAVCTGGLADEQSRADLTITTRSRSIIPSIQILADQPFEASTLYISGSKYRTDFMVFSVISDGDKTYLLDRADNSYITTTRDESDAGPFIASGLNKLYPNAASKPVSASPVPGHKGETSVGIGDTFTLVASSGPNERAKVLKLIDTGQTISYLGHTVHRYIEIQQIPEGAGNTPVRVRAEILTATDFPPTQVAEFKAACKDDLSRTSVPGIPLKITTRIPGGTLGTIVQVEEVTAISAAPLADSVFAIPKRYTQAPAKLPGTAL